MTCRKSKIIFQDHNRPLTCENVELRGFEPLTFCMPYRPGPSLNEARRRPACRSPAWILAGYGLVSPGVWRCWLPTWLPGNSLAPLNSSGRSGAGPSPFCFLCGPLDQAGGPAMGVACLAGGDDQHAIVSLIFQVKEPQQGHSQFGTVGSGTAQEVRGAAVVITAMPRP